MLILAERASKWFSCWLSQQVVSLAYSQSKLTIFFALAQPIGNQVSCMLSIRITNQHKVNYNQFPNPQSKYALHTRNKFYRTLSQRRNDSIVDWVNVEQILAHTESTRKFLKFQNSPQNQLRFLKILVFQVLGTIRTGCTQKLIANYAPMIYTECFWCVQIHYEGKWEGVGPWKSRDF